MDVVTIAAVMLSLLGLDMGDRSSNPESVECSLEVDGRKAMIDEVVVDVLSMSSFSLLVSLLLVSAVAVPAAAVVADIGKAALHDAVVDVVFVLVVTSSDAIFTSILWGWGWVC
jgi:hypothetical protein